MIVIGEKINCVVPVVKKAVEQRDKRMIRELAQRQVEAGAHYLDVCAGSETENETEIILWMMDVVQNVVDTPLCIDSKNVRVIEEVIQYAKRPGIINSVSCKDENCDAVFALIKETHWQIIVQTIQKNGVPEDPRCRFAIADAVYEKALKHGIAPDRLHIDPIVAAVSKDHHSLRKFMQTADAIKTSYPAVKITAAISNISLGMPLRKKLNQHFYALASYVGLDSAILDPCDGGMRTSILTMDALLSRS